MTHLHIEVPKTNFVSTLRVYHSFKKNEVGGGRGRGGIAPLTSLFRQNFCTRSRSRCLGVLLEMNTYFTELKEMYRKNWWQYDKISRKGNFTKDFNRSAVGFYNKPSKNI